MEQLTNQVASLRVLTENLEQINASNANTITSLNAQITALNTKISELTTSSEDSLNRINALNNKINQLQKTISYYEEYIANLENDNQAVVTFEYDGSIYTIQIVTKGSKIAVVNPESTTYKVFNGWLLNNESVDLETIIVNNNIKLIADVTYKFDVKFMNGDVEHDAQIVAKNSYPTIPTNPTKEGYRFDGWSADGINIVTNIDSTAVVENITYTAMFTKVHSVKYMLENMVDHEQQVANNEYPTEFVISSTNKRVFNGWKLNGVIVDPTTIRITADTIFVADLTYKYEITFTSPYLENDKVTQYIEAGQKIRNIPTLTNIPTGFIFRGWVDEVNPDVIIDFDTFTVSNDMHFTARVEEVHGFDEVKTTDVVLSDNVYNSTYSYFNEGYVKHTFNYDSKNVLVFANTRVYKVDVETREVSYIKDIGIIFNRFYNIDNYIYCVKFNTDSFSLYRYDIASNELEFVGSPDLLRDVSYSYSNVSCAIDRIMFFGCYEHKVNNKSVKTGACVIFDANSMSFSSYLPFNYKDDINSSSYYSYGTMFGYSLATDYCYLLTFTNDNTGDRVLYILDSQLNKLHDFYLGHFDNPTEPRLITYGDYIALANYYNGVDYNQVCVFTADFDYSSVDNLVYEEPDNGVKKIDWYNSYLTELVLDDTYYSLYTKNGKNYLCKYNISTKEYSEEVIPTLTSISCLIYDSSNNILIIYGCVNSTGSYICYYL